jgi:hypothetical protein
MSAWKNRFVVLTMIFLGVSFLIFLVTGYTALYWAWARANLATARPYLPWARNSGMLAMAGAAEALGILFSSKTFSSAQKNEQPRHDYGELGQRNSRSRNHSRHGRVVDEVVQAAG